VHGQAHPERSVSQLANSGAYRPRSLYRSIIIVIDLVVPRPTASMLASGNTVVMAAVHRTVTLINIASLLTAGVAWSHQ